MAIEGPRRAAQRQNHLPEPGMMQAGKGLWREPRARLGCDKCRLQKKKCWLRQ